MGPKNDVIGQLLDLTPPHPLNPAQVRLHIYFIYDYTL